MVLIGVGRFGRNHLRVLKELEDEGLCTVYGVVDRRVEVLEDVRNNFDVTTSSDLRDILSSDVDAVDIVTPADTHFRICEDCLAAGKHTFVEKPLTTNYTEAKKLVRLATEKNKTLMVGHIFRYNRAVKTIKKLIRLGDLGKIYYMYGHYMGFKEPRAEVGALLNFAVHPIDIYDYLLEEIPESVTCNVAHFLGREEFEDVAILLLKYGSGAVGIIETSWLPPGYHRDLTIVGSRKSITCDLAKQEVTVHDIHMDRKNGAFKAIKRKSSDIDVEIKEPLKLELKDFLDCLRTGRKSIADGQVASRIIMIAEKALMSARLKRSVKIDESK